MNTSEKLRQVEADFKKRALQGGAQPGISVGPQGVSINILANISLPFKQMLAQADASGNKTIPDTVLVLMLREVEEEMKDRELKP